MCLAIKRGQKFGTIGKRRFWCMIKSVIKHYDYQQKEISKKR